MFKYSIFIVGILILIFFFYPKSEVRFFDTKNSIVLIDGSAGIEISHTKMDTVGKLLEEKKITLDDGDEVFPNRDTRLSSGMTLFIKRQRNFSLEVDQKKESLKSSEETIGSALEEKGIQLDQDDIVEPSLETALSDKVAIKITRVTLSEETEETAIPFKTETKEDDTLSWRKKEVQQKGEKGVLTTTLRIARHDGKEVKRTILSKTITKEPVTEVEVQGTLVKTGKSHNGNASWYAYTGTLSAANPWLPLGSYVRVTNTANGKSVIVKINDRGPFGGGRIIDLDKVAFQEIASLGQGVVSVKMEEITN